MNILLVTADYVSPLSGGIARMTYLLASELRSKGHPCVSAYLRTHNPLRSNDEVFMGEYLLQKETHNQQLQGIIDAHSIDFIIVQGVDAVMNQELIQIHNVVKRQQRSIRILFVFHQMPGYELCEIDGEYLFCKLLSKECVKYIKKLLIQIISRVNKRFARRQLYSKYNIPYTNADKIVLLSKNYVNDFNLLAVGADKSKYTYIPNMLTYSKEKCAASNIKGRKVLIVARMDEHAKRIKRALQIWSRISRKRINEEWNLIIIGDGDDLAYYKKYVEKHNIKNVSFEGKQNPLPYYQQASIFMMTSAFEGWPMTLMEAMQHGCVPIVFNSFKAVYDIVDNHKNGIIVAYNDAETYLNELERLMQDDNFRKQLAKNAMKDCMRFDKEHVVNQWIELFNSYKKDL